MPFDLALDPPRGAPHVHGQRGDRHGRDERQHAFPQRLVRGLLETASRRAMLSSTERAMPQCTAGTR